MPPGTPIPRMLPAPELLTSGSPMVDGGPSEGAVQVREGSYPGRAGMSSGEVKEMSMTPSDITELLWDMIVREGGLRLY